jgi:peroxiredoxin
MKGRFLAGVLAASMAAGSAVPARADDSHPPVAPGFVVPEFTAQAVDGTTRQVAYPKGSATVLLFFLSSCPTCHKMLPEWNRAYQRRAKNVNVVGVLLDRAPAGFFEAFPVAFPVVQSPSRDFLNAYKVSRTPTTVRIAAGGKVENHGVGILDPITLGEYFRP